jgi:hypothetical protein
MGRGRSFFKIGFPLLWGILLSFTSLEAKPKVEFSIVYSNDVMGEVEPCG